MLNNKLSLDELEFCKRIEVDFELKNKLINKAHNNINALLIP